MSRESRDVAFTEFVAARGGHLRRVAYALCGDWHRADDLLQTALTKLYVAWPRLELDGGEEAYARRIIVRANVDEHRRPWRRERPGLDAVDPVERSAPERQVEDRTVLFAALQQLPSMQRKVVVLRYWLGLSVPETADELGIGQGTVKSHAARGRAHLERVLTETPATPA